MFVFNVCSGFGWGRVNFLHNSSYGAMLWICDQNSVDNIRMFWLLLSSAYAASKLSLLRMLLPQWVAEGVQNVGEDAES